MIGKFKTPEALLHSYECLEKEFTKKCQRIKELEEQLMNEQTRKAYECCTSKEVEQCVECPMREFGVTQLDCKTELLRKIKPTTVYEVKIDWATRDAQDCTTEIYSTEEQAKKAMNFEIVQAMQDYGCFDEETGELDDDDLWVLEQRDNYWHLFEEGWWSTNHCLITLTEKEVK